MKTGSAMPRNSSPATLAGATSTVSRRSGAKAQPQNRPSGAAVDNPWSHYLRSSLPAAALRERAELVDIVDRALREGHAHLDFQHVSAPALKALPGAALKALSRQVDGVTLPAGLDALPRCLNRLKGLRSIEMDQCVARQIDVTRWDLDTLTVTGPTALRWIDANEGTRVSCPAPGIRRKVCVNVYRDGELLGHSAAGSRRYIKVPDRREINRNGLYRMRRGQLALCQSITAWWLGARAARHVAKRSGTLDAASDMYAPLQNRRSFRRAITTDLEAQYDQALMHATRNNMVGNDRFGEVIANEFRRMRRSGIPAKKLFQANSNTHAMGLELTLKNGRNGKPEYSLVFYDPNMTTTHVRSTFHRTQDASELTFTGLFVDKKGIAKYFGAHVPVVTLVDLDSVRPRGKRSLGMMLTDREKSSALTLNLAIRDGFDVGVKALIGELRANRETEIDWKAILLSRSDLKEIPLFMLAMEAGRPRLAGALAELAIGLITEGALEKGALFEMLQQKVVEDDVQYVALGLACDTDNREFIGRLIDALVKPEADGLATCAEYETLLTNGGANVPSPYARAIHCGHIGAALSMVEGMLRLTDANRITRDQFVRLLACRDNDGVPALEKAFEEGNAELVLALMQPLISPATETFSVRQLLAMLSVARSDGTPALRATYGAGQAELLAAYGKLILSAVARERIRPLDAIVLLTATKRGETPCEALLAMMPRGDMLRTLDHLLHDVRVARWLPNDLSEALDALYTEDPSDPDSDSSSRG